VQESDILLKAIMDGGKHSILVTHPSGIVKVMNRAAERLYGFPASHFIGRHISNFRKEVYDRSELEAEAEKLGREAGEPIGVDEAFMLALHKYGVYEREWTAIRSDGAKIQVLVSVTIMKGQEGETAGFLSISQDISERKKLERMKSEFISTVSHELRTPLTSIRGALGLMVGGAAGSLPPVAADLAALAHRNSERLVRIINDILDMDKIESGKFSFDIRAFAAGDIVRQSLEENRAYGEKYGVRFVLKSSPGRLAALADPDRVLQVLANLLSNAAKFSPRDAEVWVTVEDAVTSLRFSVRDFGKGIPEAFRSHVFEKFAQSENADALRHEGTGLGLSITQKMVEAMGGSIRFETETGAGTTFTFTLPKAFVAEEAATPDAAGGVDGEEARILICEDDADVATLLKMLLEKAGHAADVAGTLAEARHKLRTRAYAALTLDLILPDGDGLEFLNELRADPEWKRLPVVVISAKAEEGKLRATRDESAGDPVELVDWVSKPLDENILTRSLEWAARTIRNKNPRILHVEDNADLRKILAGFFQDHAEWVEASTLEEARALIQSQAFDLIVLDLGLPDGSGLELLEEMKSFTGRPVPVLILSADEPDESIRKRVASVLLKSRVSEERVVETVLDLLRKQPPRVAPGGKTETAGGAERPRHRPQKRESGKMKYEI
jgi:PAS domain S-box-containing protein